MDCPPKKVAIVESYAVSGGSTGKRKSSVVSSITRAQFICLQTCARLLKVFYGTFLHKLVRNRLQEAGILSCAQRSVRKGNMLVCESGLWECPLKFLFAALLLTYGLTHRYFS